MPKALPTAKGTAGVEESTHHALGEALPLSLPPHNRCLPHLSLGEYLLFIEEETEAQRNSEMRAQVAEPD